MYKNRKEKIGFDHHRFSFPDVAITITEVTILLSQAVIATRPTAEKKEGDTGQQCSFA